MKYNKGESYLCIYWPGNLWKSGKIYKCTESGDLDLNIETEEGRTLSPTWNKKAKFIKIGSSSKLSKKLYEI
jgi:hypothetical protein